MFQEIDSSYRLTCSDWSNAKKIKGFEKIKIERENRDIVPTLPDSIWYCKKNAL